VWQLALEGVVAGLKSIVRLERPFTAIRIILQMVGGLGHENLPFCWWIRTDYRPLAYPEICLESMTFVICKCMKSQ